MCVSVEGLCMGGSGCVCGAVCWGCVLGVSVEGLCMWDCVLGEMVCWVCPLGCPRAVCMEVRVGCVCGSMWRACVCGAVCWGCGLVCLWIYVEGLYIYIYYLWGCVLGEGVLGVSVGLCVGRGCVGCVLGEGVGLCVGRGCIGCVCGAVCWERVYWVCMWGCVLGEGVLGVYVGLYVGRAVQCLTSRQRRLFLIICM